MNTTTEVIQVLNETLEDSILRCKSLGLNPDKYSTVIKARGLLDNLAKEKLFFNMSKEEQEEVNKHDLKELKAYYGNWDDVRKLIDQLEDNDNEAAWERHCTDY